MIEPKKMTADERKALMAELAKEQKAEKLKRKEDLATFKQLTVEYVEKNIDKLIHHRSTSLDLINELFNDFKSIKAIKEMLYGIKENQETHTSTLPDGSASITVGFNVNIGFDGTESAGIEKIKKVLMSLSTEEENNVKLSKAIHRLLRPSAKTGQFNPSSIIELSNMREDFNDPLFDEGLDIIIAAQQKRKNSMFVSGWKFVTGENGIPVKIEFRFSI